jgi:hypothetical protein
MGSFLGCALLLRLGFESKVTWSCEGGIPLWPRNSEMEVGEPLLNRFSKEMDPAKLMILVANLCCALEVERRQNRQPGGVILRERA